MSIISSSEKNSSSSSLSIFNQEVRPMQQEEILEMTTSYLTYECLKNKSLEKMVFLLKQKGITAHLCYNLACKLLLDQTICSSLKDQIPPKENLFFHALRLNPNHSQSYLQFARCFNKQQEFSISGQKMSKQFLLIAAIDCDDTNSWAYYELAQDLNPNQQINIRQGTCYNQKQLLLKAIDLNENLSGAYSYLASLLKEEELLILHNQTPYSKQQLAEKATALDPENFEHYFRFFASSSLIATLDFQGVKLKAQQFYVQFLKHNPNHQQAYQALRAMLTQPLSIAHSKEGDESQASDSDGSDRLSSESLSSDNEEDSDLAFNSDESESDAGDAASSHDSSSEDETSSS
ncbi:MAG: hypothetical protein QRY72_01585 [Candidatus Rhabdochlamydia sp.]